MPSKRSPFTYYQTHYGLWTEWAFATGNLHPVNKGCKRFWLAITIVSPYAQSSSPLADMIDSLYGDCMGSDSYWFLANLNRRRRGEGSSAKLSSSTERSPKMMYHCGGRLWRRSDGTKNHVILHTRTLLAWCILNRVYLRCIEQNYL